MTTSWISRFQRFLLPGFVFQSLIIAGGYGTGRELVEFFLKYGPLGGLLGMLLPAALLMSVICLIAFELARLTKSYDYRSFLRQLLGPFWFLYEIGYLAAVLLILAVIGAATGALLSETFGVQGSIGTVVLLAVIAFLAFKGTGVIEDVLSIWSFVLYDPQTRSILQTPSTARPSLGSQSDPKPAINDDGSYTIYFGPTAPEGKESNWIQTVPGKGWFTILRLYGPLEPWFDKSWKPGEIELIPAD